MHPDLPKIYKYIKSMRDRERPMAYDEIKRSLLFQNFDEVAVNFAIKNARNKEELEMKLIRSRGGMLETLGSYMIGAFIIGLGLYALFVTSRLIYFLFVPARHIVVNGKSFGLSSGKHIIAIIIFGLAIGFVPVGIRRIRWQIDIRKQYLKKKSQGLIK